MSKTGKSPPVSYKRVRTPTVLQMEALECGAAALGIILAYHGRIEPLEVLRVACGVSRDGSKAGSIVKAARSYGMEAKGFKMELEALRSQAPPFIVFWNFNHFVVVEGFGKNRVFLNDPARGPTTVTLEEFDQAYTGVVLCIQPGPEFKKGGRATSMWDGLGRRLQGARLALTYVVLVNLALVLPGLCVPTFGRVFVDDIVVSGARNWLTPLLLVMALTALLRGLLTSLLRHYMGRLETRLALSTASRFLWHLLKLPYVFFQQRYAGDLSARVNTNERLARLLSGDLAQSVLSCVMIVFYGALMMTYDRLLCSIAVVLALLNLLAVSRARRRRLDENQRLIGDRSQLYGVMVRGLQIIETLKASGGEDDFFAQWGGYQAKVASSEQRLGLMNQLLNTVPGLLSSISTATILGIGALRVMDGHLTMGQLIAFQTLSASFLLPVTSLVNLGATIQEVEGDLRRLDDVLSHKPDPAVRLETEPEPEEKSSASENRPARLLGYVEFRDVRYGYSRLVQPLIDAFTLAIQPGHRVALVGGSGSGKSTVAKLLAGLFEPWAGTILFDGQPRHTFAREVLCNSIAVIDQDVVLFEGTVRDNLTMWDATIPEAAVIAAAKDAAIHDDIVVRPGGYAARVEEGGRNFSGGQRQRLEIARALVRGPSVLVIDEGTSALDPVTELTVERNLRRRGCSCLIVAHRLSTIRDCDEILVLDRGQVVERGTHASLLRENGHYAALVRSA